MLSYGEFSLTSVAPPKKQGICLNKTAWKMGCWHYCCSLGWALGFFIIYLL